MITCHWEQQWNTRMSLHREARSSSQKKEAILLARESKNWKYKSKERPCQSNVLIDKAQYQQFQGPSLDEVNLYLSLSTF